MLTEGKTDACYVRTALDLFGKKHLLEAIDVEPVGTETEDATDDGGKSSLNRIAGFYRKYPSLLHRPIILLYDCDANKGQYRVGKLWVQGIPSNTENTRVTKGIEVRFDESLFEDRFYAKNPSNKGDGGFNVVLDKKAFCDWICTKRRERGDFAGFDVVVKMLEEFVDAHLSQ